MTHTGEKPHKCPICLKQFIEKSNRNQHVKSYHTGLPNKCDQCCRSFKDLITHQVSFHSIKTIKCTKCDKFLGKFYKMNQHKRRAHKELKNSGPVIKVEKEEGELGIMLEEGEIVL